MGTDITFLDSYAYNPSKLRIAVDGEKVTGFLSDKKAFIRRGLNGRFEMDIFLQTTAVWVPKLREMLGHEVSISVSYPGEYANHFGIESEAVLVGADFIFSNELPIVVFHFKSKEKYARSRK